MTKNTHMCLRILLFHSQVQKHRQQAAMLSPENNDGLTIKYAIIQNYHCKINVSKLNFSITSIIQQSIKGTKKKKKSRKKNYTITKII